LTITIGCNISFGVTAITNRIDAKHVKDTVVTIVGNNINGVVVGCGFVIGDGSLVVTAAHNLLDNKGIGKHCGLSVATVTSPYLGKSVVGKIIALDTGSDLAILLVNWKHHPTLTIPNIDTIRSATSVEVFGLVNTYNKQLAFATIAAVEKLSIARILEMDAVPALVAMRNPEALVTGWSGAPIVVAGTNQVIGCFASKPTNARDNTVAIGASSNQIALLLQDTKYKHHLKQTETITPKSNDGYQIYCEYLRFLYASSINVDPIVAKITGHKLIQLRPHDALGYYCVGTILTQDPNQFVQADHYYQLALEKDSDNIATKFKLALLLLKHRKHDQSEELFRQLLKENYARELVAMHLGQIYLAQKKPEQLELVLAPILKMNRANGYLWHLRSQLNQMLYTSCIKPAPIDYQSKAIEYMTKFSNLFDDINIQLALGALLVSYNEIDAAENHYQMILSDNRDNRVVIFQMTQFLKKYRSEMLEETSTFVKNGEPLNTKMTPELQPMSDKTLNQLTKELSDQLD